jgi:hypothetical protein
MQKKAEHNLEFCLLQIRNKESFQRRIISLCRSGLAGYLEVADTTLIMRIHPEQRHRPRPEVKLISNDQIMEAAEECSSCPDVIPSVPDPLIIISALEIRRPSELRMRLELSTLCPAISAR